MSRYKLPRIGALLLGFMLLLALGGSAAQAALVVSTDTRLFSNTNSQYDCSGPASAPDSLGLPAIQPHLPGIPTFTRDDVRGYIQEHGFQGGKIGSARQPTITRILFITSREACELMRGEYVGLPNDSLVCYVEFSGTFSVSGPAGTASVSGQHADEVFDARTGSLLIVGTSG